VDLAEDGGTARDKAARVASGGAGRNRCHQPPVGDLEA
jgi:hypothetical protein